jgi:translation initiation factor 2B subunit (eIF-2B alpha/beta/delta family)
MFCDGVVQSQNKRDDIWNKIENIKVEKLIKRLDLDESTAVQFKEKYVSFGKTIRELNQRRALVYKLMAENLQSGDGLDTLVDRLVNIEDRINTERKAFADELKTILTIKQIATLIIFERKFNTELRKLLQEYMKKKIRQNN